MFSTRLDNLTNKSDRFDQFTYWNQLVCFRIIELIDLFIIFQIWRVIYKWEETKLKEQANKTVILKQKEVVTRAVIKFYFKKKDRAIQFCIV